MLVVLVVGGRRRVTADRRAVLRARMVVDLAVEGIVARLAVGRMDRRVGVVDLAAVRGVRERVRTVTVVVVVIIVVSRVNRRISLLIVRRHGEGGLVRIDVLLASALEALVAGETVVPFVVLEGVDAEEGGDAEQEAREKKQELVWAHA